jgi:hypothetical protein
VIVEVCTRSKHRVGPIVVTFEVGSSVLRSQEEIGLPYSKEATREATRDTASQFATDSAGVKRDPVITVTVNLSRQRLCLRRDARLVGA